MGVLAMMVYLGCYTDAAHTNGLYAVEVDAGTGAMTILIQPLTKIYLVSTKCQRFAHKGSSCGFRFGEGKKKVSIFTKSGIFKEFWKPETQNFQIYWQTM